MMRAQPGCASPHKIAERVPQKIILFMKSKVWILHVNNEIHDKFQVFATEHEALAEYINAVAWLMPDACATILHKILKAGQQGNPEWEAFIETFVKSPSEYSLQEYELDLPVEKIVVEVRGGVAYCDHPDVEIIDYD
jgi:hypothetical protein